MSDQVSASATRFISLQGMGPPILMPVSRQPCSLAVCFQQSSAMRDANGPKLGILQYLQDFNLFHVLQEYLSVAFRCALRKFGVFLCPKNLGR